jgi:hypothetical protein
VLAWFKAQDDYTRAVLARVPGRQQLLEHIKQLDQSAPYQVFSLKRCQGEKYRYQKSLATEEVSKLYERDGLSGSEKLLVDPGQFVTQPGTHDSLLAGQGGSAGGILIGRAFTERPDLFAAALDDVGLSDMIPDMFSPDWPSNVPEYGDLKTEDGFKNLYEISAHYHVKKATSYPAVMLTTGINDPRVVSWEPGKMAVRLQAATAGGKPVLLRVDYQGGHGGIGETRTQRDELLADQWSFLLWQFGVPEFQPKP